MMDFAIAAIGWEPEIRGALVVLISVVILCGSIYLILATNSGSRLGFLLAFTGLMGWNLIMGIIWTLYGIGLVGDSPTWVVTEVHVGDPTTVELEEARDLSDWRVLPPGDGDRGEAQAAVDVVLSEGSGNADLFTVDGNYVGYTPVAAYSVGGKERLEGKKGCSPIDPSTYSSCWDRTTHRFRQTIQLRHPVHYAAIQVQRNEPQDEGFVGQDEIDDDSPIVTVLMERDLGNRRLPPFLVTVYSGVLFGVGCWQLHRRDKIAMANMANAGA